MPGRTKLVRLYINWFLATHWYFSREHHRVPLLPGNTFAKEHSLMAENTFQKTSITIEAAQRMIAAAEAKAREMGMAMCISICDGDGTLKAFSRMDGAALLSVQIAHDKAYTAISLC